MTIVVALLAVLLGIGSITPQTGEIKAEFTFTIEGDLFSIYLAEDQWWMNNLTASFSPKAWFPVWSPDAQHLAFLAKEGADTSLYVMDSDRTITELKAGLPYVGSLVWSPSSSMLAYTTVATGKMANHLHIQNLATSDSLDLPNNVAGCCIQWLTDSSLAYIGENSWSPHVLSFENLAQPRRIKWQEFSYPQTSQNHIPSYNWDKTLQVIFRQSDPRNQYLAVILAGLRQSKESDYNDVAPPRLIIYDHDFQEVVVVVGVSYDEGSWRPLPPG